MNGVNPFSSDQWIQQYPNTAMTPSGGEPSDNTTIPVHRDSSSQGTTGQAGPKPIRRRSRASRRTPTTILNASPTDFRALVQRFTGCARKDDVASVSAPVLNLPKGPLNIDFARSESSSRYTYYDNQVRLPLQAEQMQSIGGLSDMQDGYGMENTSVVYETIDESSLMATGRDGGNRGPWE